MRSCCWCYFLVLCFPVSLLAQDFGWWNDEHNWDGTTHWSSYLQLAPGFMGPNAFPIPYAERINTKREFDLRYNNHSNLGETNWDFYTRFSFPIGEKTAIRFEMNPIEYFEMDSIIRNQRFVRDEYPKGYASGDLLVEVNAKIHESEKNQMLFNMGLKTASGSQFRNARYTDSPAYYFNLSYHYEKVFSANFKIDLSVLLGLYVWQTYMVNNRQNDAILAASSIRLYYKSYSLIQDLRGFKGYLNNGDQPLLYSIKFAKNWSHIQMYVRQQFSIIDYPFHTSQLGATYIF